MDLTVPEIALLALVGLIAGLLPSTLAERRGIRLAADIGAGVAGVFVAAWLVASWRDLVPFSLTTPAGKPQEKVSVDLNLPNYEPVVLPLAPLRPLLKPVVFRSREEICETLVQAALSNDLPVPFFIRLLYQESTFRPAAISTAGALGIAQFMPETAAHRRLDNPFDPAQAIPASARLLRDHYRRFGNLGLAAAAYNAGSRRVDDWRGKKGPMPQETQDYVKAITGFPVESWTMPLAGGPAVKLPQGAPCQEFRRPAGLGRARRDPDAGGEPARAGGEGRRGSGARIPPKAKKNEKADDTKKQETKKETKDGAKKPETTEQAAKDKNPKAPAAKTPDAKIPDAKEPAAKEHDAKKAGKKDHAAKDDGTTGADVARK